MEKDFKIELLEDEAVSADHVQLPLNFVAIGEIANDDVKVYIRQDVYKQLEQFAASDTKKELGSILLGGFNETMGKMHVVISEYIEAKYTDASASTLTFTHETWDYIHREHEALHPDLKILGWQHTHPNYGIFLSNYDMFIQENFFNMPFQVAYVIDPIRHIRGFFQWKNGKVEKLKGFYIYDAVGKPIKIEQEKAESSVAPVPVSTKKQAALIISLTAVFILAAAFLYFTMSNRLQDQLQQQEQLQQIILQQDADIKALQNTLGDSAVVSGDPDALEALIARLESQPAVSENQASMLAELKALLAKARQDDSAAVTFQPYMVLEGDCLSAVCARFGLDYQANISLIKALNGIENENAIYVGQTLILPIVETDA